MNIIFAGMPVPGHLLPMLPLLRAFRDRGDNVAVLAGGAAAPLLQPEGVELLEAGPTMDEFMREMGERLGATAGVGEVSAEVEAEAFAGIVVDYGLDAARAASRKWAPDLVVSEYYDSLGRIVAADLGVPVAGLGIGPALRPRVREAIRVRVARQYEKAGVAPRTERWYLDTCPPSLQRDGWRPEGASLLLRPEPYGPPAGTAAVAHEGIAAPAHAGIHAVPGNGDSERPRVLISFGTLQSDPAIVKPYLEGLLDLDVDLRVTLGFRSQASDYGIASDRVEFAGFTPMSRLLDGIDAVLTHGGSGTVLAALSRGIPMVVAPVGADQPVQAERVAAAGAGIAFPVGVTAPAEIADAVTAVLGEPSYADAAQAVAAEIAAIRSPQDVAASLAADLVS